jgi:hypothetical protein
MAFLLEERKRCSPSIVPVYEELFEQLGRSLWGLMFDEKREDREMRRDAAELLEVIRKWEAKVEERVMLTERPKLSRTPL